MSLNIAIVGCGKIADGHVEAIQKFHQARLVAVCDLEPIMAEQLAVRYSVPQWFDDFDRMLATVPLDVIHITTPPGSHVPLGIKAIDARCHVFMEKPLSLNYQSGSRLIEHARHSNRKLTINYWHNFAAPTLALHRLIAEGTIGEVIHLESFLGYTLAGDFGRALLNDPNHWVHYLPGKLFHNTLDHVLNKIAPFLTDCDPHLEVAGYRRRPAAMSRADAVFDELRVLLKGTKVSAYATFSAHAKPAAHFLRVYGTRSTVHLDYNLQTVTLEAEQKLPSAIGRLLPPFGQAWNSLKSGTCNVRAFMNSRFHFFAGLNELVSRFYRSILDDAPPPIDYEEILRVAALMDAIFVRVAQEESVLV